MLYSTIRISLWYLILVNTENFHKIIIADKINISEILAFCFSREIKNNFLIFKSHLNIRIILISLISSDSILYNIFKAHY